MFHANPGFIIVLLINNILLQCSPPSYAYTQVAVDGSSSSSSASDGPKIYKAVNFDLIFPKSFNSTENVISTTPETIIASPPKTAGVGQAFYPLTQSNERPPYNHQPGGAEEIIPGAAATIDNDKQQPTLYITPPPPSSSSGYEGDSDTKAAAIIYERHQNTNGNNYNNYNNGPPPPQVVTPNPINIQQQQQRQQQSWEQYEGEQQQQQLNVNNKAKMILQEQHVEEQEQHQQQQQNLATGRAVDYQSGYPFGQLITPLIKNTPQQPVYRKPVASYTTYPLTRKTAASSASSSASSSSSLASGSNVGKIIYPQAMYQRKSPSQAEIDKLRGKGSFRDRFSPSEGVASFNFKNNHDHTHDHSHDHSHDHAHQHNHAPAPSGSGGGGKTPSASNTINSFAVPSTNLYSFPPNNINYPKPNQDIKLALPSGQVNSYSAPASGSPLKDTLYNKGKVNSYIAPASGPLKNANYNLITAGSNNSPYQYNGPVSTSYLPASDGGAGNDSSKGGAGNDGGGDGDIVSDSADDTVGVLPASAMDQLNDGKDSGGGGKDMDDAMSSDDMGPMADAEEGKANDDHSYDTGKEYPTPPPGWLEEHPESAHSPHDHDHHHDHHPDIIYDHDHDHYHHDVYPSFPSFPIYPSYPHLIYHDHDHHHLPDIEPQAPMATTTEEPPPPPPPEPKPEPRVKKYSYFYIGRKLWYIPLYFTIWFSFYVLWLILKSIARHKVQLPNHYTGDLPNRYVNRRSLEDSYDFSKIKQETLNDLTISVLNKIDQFREKYLNGN